MPEPRVSPLFRALALVVSGGTATLLVLHSGLAGCQGPSPGPITPDSATASGVAASAAEASPARAPSPASAVPATSAPSNAGGQAAAKIEPSADPEFFGTSKAGPIRPRIVQPASPQQAPNAPNPAPQPQQGSR